MLICQILFWRQVEGIGCKVYIFISNMQRRRFPYGHTCDPVIIIFDCMTWGQDRGHWLTGRSIAFHTVITKFIYKICDDCMENGFLRYPSFTRQPLPMYHSKILRIEMCTIVQIFNCNDRRVIDAYWLFFFYRGEIVGCEHSFYGN